jgi:hypothetical protein
LKNASTKQKVHTFSSGFARYLNQNKLFLLIVSSVIILYFITWYSFPSARETFAVEFYAGFLGILIAFYLDRSIEQRKSDKINKQIISSLIEELNNNLNLIKTYPKLNPRTNFLSESFCLFQTSAWEMFSSKLELDSIKILFDLGTIYHKFETLNEAMKLESEGNELTNLLGKNPRYMEELSKRVKEIIQQLETIL